MNGKSSGALSGAASGAVSGAMIGSVVPVVGTAIGAVAGGVLGGAMGFLGGSASDDAMEAQLEWNEYNAKTQYDIDVSNMSAGLAISEMNSKLIRSEAEYKADVLEATADYDTRMIASTIGYNNLLGEQEAELIWESAGLDAKQISMYRERERGQMIATQAASGIVVDRGTYHKVVEDQKAQQAIDTFIVYRNAQVRTAQLLNATAKSTWEGDMQIKRIQWNGQIASQQARVSAGLQSTTMLESALVKEEAAKVSAKQRYDTTITSGMLREASYETENDTNLVNGLFSAAGQAASMFGGMGGGGGGGGPVPNAAGYSDMGSVLTSTPSSMSGGWSQVGSSLSGTPSSMAGGYSNVGFNMNYDWGA